MAVRDKNRTNRAARQYSIYSLRRPSLWRRNWRRILGSNPSVQINVKWLGGLVDVEAEGGTVPGIFIFDDV